MNLNFLRTGIVIGIIGLLWSCMLPLDITFTRLDSEHDLMVSLICLWLCYICIINTKDEDRSSLIMAAVLASLFLSLFMYLGLSYNPRTNSFKYSLKETFPVWLCLLSALMFFVTYFLFKAYTFAMRLYCQHCKSEKLFSTKYVLCAGWAIVLTEVWYLNDTHYKLFHVPFLLIGFVVVLFSRQLTYIFARTYHCKCGSDHWELDPPQETIAHYNLRTLEYERKC